MHQGSDYNSSYYPYQSPHPNPNPNPNPNEFAPSPAIPPPFSAASAPPYSHYAAVADPSFYAPYSHPSDPAPAPQPQPQPQFAPYQSQSYNPHPFPSDSPITTYPHQYSFDQPHHPPAAPSYNPNPSPIPNPNLYPNPNPSYDTHAPKFDQGAGYFGEGLGTYGLTVPAGYGDGPGEGVYRYDGGGAEPYGARGTGSSARSSWSGGFDDFGQSGFDDYGRSKSSSAGKDRPASAVKIVRAVPKADGNQDAKSGVQKFRVKLLPEGGGHGTTDVLCQIGLDGIRMLDPSTSRTLRIYPLETVTRWEVADPSIYTFWSKSSVDIEPRRIRLQSNSYTTSTLLDTVTAATVQLKEMGGRENLGRGSADAKPLDQPTEKKKGIVDWVNLIKPGNEEKDHWVPDEAVSKCTSCRTDFGAFVRRHHCRNCGDIFCDKCTQGRTALTADEHAQPVRVCDRCMIEVSQRLSNAKEATNKSAVLHSHEDLARKLQEEMDKKKSSSVSKSSDGLGRRMREVACPTCTVHLQVQVPSSGSETVECGVCQHPFLVSAH